MDTLVWSEKSGYKPAEINIISGDFDFWLFLVSDCLLALRAPGPE